MISLASGQQMNLLIVALVVVNIVIFVFQVHQLSHRTDKNSSHKHSILSRDPINAVVFDSTDAVTALKKRIAVAKQIVDAVKATNSESSYSMDKVAVLSKKGADRVSVPVFFSTSSEATATSTDVAVNVVMDWIADSDDFGYMNYKSLDSLLMQYPNAAVTVNLIGPQPVELYKIGNLISKMYFQKYEKMGFNVRFALRYENRLANSSEAGAQYWESAFAKCCRGQLTTAEIKTKRFSVPLHLNFYRRILELYNRGGMYSDFSWYHRRPLDMFSSQQQQQQQREYHGAILTEICREGVQQSHLSAFPLLHLQELRKQQSVPQSIQLLKQQQEQQGKGHGYCYSSALMAFSKGSVVLQCMLEKYDNKDSRFRRCIKHSDTAAVDSGGSGGDRGRKRGHRTEVECIVVALQECFDHRKLRNDLLYIEPAAASTSASAATARNETQRRIEHALHSCQHSSSTSSNSGDRIMSNEKAEALSHKALLDCRHLWAALKLQSLDFSSAQSTVVWKHAANMIDICRHRLLSQEDTKGERDFFRNWYRQRAEDVFSSSSNIVQVAMQESIEHSSVLWLGSTASYSKDWLIPQPDSIFGRILQKHELRSKNPLHFLDVLEYNLSVSGNRPTAQNLILPPTSHTSLLLQQQQQQSRDAGVLAMKQPPCHHFQLPADAPESLRRQAQSRCAPLFIIAGYMKAGTTALFGAIMTHPQMVYNLRGVSFKETGCYLAAYDRNRRMQCFPYVQPHEHLYCGDGTVWHANMYLSSQLLLQDNPQLKIIFSIRDPVQRTASHHRFMFGYLRKKGLADLNEVVNVALNRSAGNLMELHDLAVDALQEQQPQQKQRKIQAVVSFYFQKVATQSKASRSSSFHKLWADVKQLVLHSIYFPSIYKWHQLAPNHQNIVVVRAEDFDPNRLDAAAKVSYLQEVMSGSQQELLLLQEQYRQLQQQQQVMQQLRSATATGGAVADSMASAVTRGSGSNSSSKSSSSDLLETAEGEAAVKAQQAEDWLDETYLLERMNSLYSFLGVAPVSSVGSYNKHATKSSRIKNSYRLSSSLELRLRQFFQPFDALLDEFLQLKAADASSGSTVADNVNTRSSVYAVDQQ